MEERDRKRVGKEERELQQEGVIESEERWKGGGVRAQMPSLQPISDSCTPLRTDGSSHKHTTTYMHTHTHGKHSHTLNGYTVSLRFGCSRLSLCLIGMFNKCTSKSHISLTVRFDSGQSVLQVLLTHTLTKPLSSG